MNSTILEIVEIYDVFAQGITKPVLCKAEDHNVYVVKGKYAGRNACIHEWLAGHLGKHIGLPIPDIALARLDPHFRQYSFETEGANILGTQSLFASRFIDSLIEMPIEKIDRLDVTLRAKYFALIAGWEMEIAL